MGVWIDQCVLCGDGDARTEKGGKDALVDRRHGYVPFVKAELLLTRIQTNTWPEEAMQRLTRGIAVLSKHGIVTLKDIDGVRHRIRRFMARIF